MGEVLLSFRVPTGAWNSGEVGDALTQTGWSQVGKSLELNGYVYATGAVDEANGNNVVDAIQEARGEIVPDEARRTGPAAITYRKEPKAPRPVQEHLCEAGPPVAKLNGRFQILINFGTVGQSRNAKPKQRRATELSDIATGISTDVTDADGDSVKVESYATTREEIDRYAKDRMAYDDSDRIIQNAELGYERRTQGEDDNARETAWVDRTQLTEIHQALAVIGREPASPWRGRATVQPLLA